LKPLLALLTLVLLAASLLACGGDSSYEAPDAAAAREVKKVTFMAGFKAQANLPFVGAYVAQEKGFFAEQALEVDIRHAQSGEHLQLLLAGEVQFTTANGAQVLQRNAQGLPVVSLALVGQRSEQGYAVLADSGIRNVADWAGKTFGYKGSVPAEFLAIAGAAGLDPGRVDKVRVSFDPRVLSEGQVDILAVFFSNEPDTLRRLGFETRVFDPNDFGIESLGLTYVASRDYIARDPDAVQRFVKAVLRGIDYAAQNREEALEIVMRYGPQEDREHQRFMLNTELDRALTEQTRRNGVGWQTRAQWQAFHDTLLTYQGIEKPVDVTSVFTDEFLKGTFVDGKLVWP
jgi:ABC-type nitrate/sulfonate/bicarbonate transport system substrate-binding protein